MGVFEFPQPSRRHQRRRRGDHLGDGPRGRSSVVGGGAAAVRKSSLPDDGFLAHFHRRGASLNTFEGKTLPGLQVLE